jgi:hypothetical protein
MRAAAVFVLTIAACASAPPANVQSSQSPAPREMEEAEPAQFPNASPAELAERIVEAQRKSHSSVTEAFAIVESMLSSKDPATATTAVAVLEELAASIARMNTGKGIDDIAYVTYHFDFFVDHVNAVLDQRLERGPCTLMFPIAEVATKFRRLPGVRAPKVTFTGPPANRLSWRETQCGMHAIQDKVDACYAQSGLRDTAVVGVTIDKDGIVSNATTTGSLAGTPTATCIEAAVKLATFPPSDGISATHLFSPRSNATAPAQP